MLTNDIISITSYLLRSKMWLARKPKGKLAAPPKQRDKKSVLVFFIMMIILGAVMPLFGLSVLVIFAIELLIYVFSKIRS